MVADYSPKGTASSRENICPGLTNIMFVESEVQFHWEDVEVENKEKVGIFLSTHAILVGFLCLHRKIFCDLIVIIP